MLAVLPSCSTAVFVLPTLLKVKQQLLEHLQDKYDFFLQYKVLSTKIKSLPDGFFGDGAVMFLFFLFFRFISGLLLSEDDREDAEGSAEDSAFFFALFVSIFCALFPGGSPPECLVTRLGVGATIIRGDDGGDASGLPILLFACFGVESADLLVTRFDFGIGENAGVEQVFLTFDVGVDIGGRRTFAGVKPILGFLALWNFDGSIDADCSSVAASEDSLSERIRFVPETVVSGVVSRTEKSV